MDLMGIVEVEENQVRTETVVIGEMRASLNPEEIEEIEETEETEESAGIEVRTESQNFPASAGWMPLRLVRFVEDFVGFVLAVGKRGSCLLAGIVMWEVLVLVKTVVGLVAGTQLSQRQLYRHHQLVDPQGVVLVVEIAGAVGQAREWRE